MFVVYVKPAATHGNGSGAHGKEEVDGSSPSEGSANPRVRIAGHSDLSRESRLIEVDALAAHRHAFGDE